MNTTNPITIIKLPNELPEKPEFDPQYRRAPNRPFNLNENDTILALKNALRYIPKELHEKLAPEFLNELITRGRIYGYRYRPKGPLIGKPQEEYKGIEESRAIQVMIDNNLDFEIALFPYELVTYGSTAQVCQNWMQYQLIKKYLEIMKDNQTLVVMSGHPLGLFPSSRNAPRVILTNGLMIGMFDNTEDFQRAQVLGVSNYGQMTCGGWMYIGPQGIVHGTYLTLLNAGRKYLNHSDDEDLKGVLYITSGLGGMSGAQGKAVEIANGITIIAEVNFSALKTRFDQGWIGKHSDNLEEIFSWVEDYRKRKESVSIGYNGNVVDLWQYVVDNDIKVELASDQTSCHAAYEGGYTPAGLSYEDGRELLKNDLHEFKKMVDKSLRRQFELIKIMHNRGTKFWDYGNSFLKAVYDAGAQDIAILKDPKNGFIFPSYVEDLVGPICFDYGYGPFRWVCLSRKDEDLDKTDIAARDIIKEIWESRPIKRGQDRDNYIWMRDAKENKMVVGTKARILYADGEGRVKIALKFNEMVRDNEIGPVMLGRDHHDVSGTDSPFRETSNIKDGSNIMADMAHQSWAGNAARGMTMVVLQNGGGVGTGKVINGGFGLVLDGSERVDNIIKLALDWDVYCGIARRAWARNPHAIETAKTWIKKKEGDGFITIPEIPDEDFVENLVRNSLKK
ncbi:urocanate hydratase [Promethearchaeum syntrophicum]|uniref:Urocanate hydratase n=1 Tax=Promethearchaeum syntrophicum TaxID=2594042 RepID=A0A5B9D512_9ARCH|nr:urocanate hydratase [Candidatus Prometheoarchaeum syntrophicum]QEE14199.1 urocanate hydratase [Candidatus Prometheoarchaeum syntrophicum]